MCWNAQVSINTFLFGIFGLAFIAFNSLGSAKKPYALEFFENPFAYFFLFTVILMQGFEYILWKHLDNAAINKMVSIAGLALLAIQPVASLLLLEVKDYPFKENGTRKDYAFRNTMLGIYGVPALLYFLYNVFTTDIHTKVSPCGHLAWKWTQENISFIAVPFYLFFLFFSLIRNGYYTSLFFLALYAAFIYYFGKDGSSGSIWCLSVNLVILYFLLQILVFIPISEMRGA